MLKFSHLHDFVLLGSLHYSLEFELSIAFKYDESLQAGIFSVNVCFAFQDMRLGKGLRTHEEG